MANSRMEDALDDLDSALEDAKFYITKAMDHLSSAQSEGTGLEHPPASVHEAMGEGLRMIEFKYGPSSREAAEVRSFIKTLEDL